MNAAWARTVCPASAVMTCPASGIVLVQLPQQRRELRDLVGLRADQPLGEHDPGAVGDGGQQVRDEAVVPGRAADRLAVHRDRGQPARPGHGKGHRAGVRAAGQVRPGMMRDALRAQRREDPHHGVRVRRHPRAQRVPPGPGRGQHLLRGGVHPRGHVLDRACSRTAPPPCTAPARRAGSAGSRAGPAGPGPPRSTPAGSRRTPRPARRRGQPARPGLLQRQRARACETERATGPPGTEKRCQQSLVLAGTPLPSPQRHAQRPQRDATGTNPAALAVTVRARPRQQPAPRTCPCTLRKVTRTGCGGPPGTSHRARTPEPRVTGQAIADLGKLLCGTPWV